MQVTPLMQAVFRSDEKLVTLLLDYRADPNLRNLYGGTALHMAVKWERQTIVALLLERGADDSITDPEGDTPLKIAIDQNFAGIQSVLQDWTNKKNA